VGLVMDIVVWLRSLGLEQYEAAFRENGVDETVLPKLTAEDVKDLGSNCAPASFCRFADIRAYSEFIILTF
jgi:hypothetical protein